MGEAFSAYRDRESPRVPVGKCEGVRPLGRPESRWKDNSNMGKMNSFYMVQDRNRWRALVNAVMNLWVP
jgi:hypothetical protein